jgi:hypothetical protein
MDNNRFFRNTRTNFENDLQDILTNYLNENMGDILNESNNDNINRNNDNINRNNDNINRNNDNINRNNDNINRNNESNDNNYVHSNYYVINRILDGLSDNMNAYHRNYREYLSLLREIINTLPDNQRNINTNANNSNNTRTHDRPNVFTSPFARNIPLTPISTTRRNPLYNSPRPLNRNTSNTTRHNAQQPERFDHVLTYTINSPNNLFTNTNNNMADLFNSIFQNVVIRPTQEEINNATESIIYNTDMELGQERCPISLENFHDGDQLLRIRHCGHIFGNLSLQSWFNSNVRCPVCRFDIRDTDNNIDDNNEANENDISFNSTTLRRTNSDSSGNLAFRLEIPVHYTEIYDESNNLIRRDFH